MSVAGERSERVKLKLDHHSCIHHIFTSCAATTHRVPASATIKPEYTGILAYQQTLCEASNNSISNSGRK